MTRRMLINAQRPEELRIAIISDSTLDDYQVESAEKGLTRGNIYRGTVANIQPSLNAAFIDYGSERHGFLAIQDVVPDAYHKKHDGKSRPKIEEVLERGKKILVQVAKEAEGTKGAALTTNLSLAGRYLVLTPFDDTRGVSRKVEDDKDRKRLREMTKTLKVPKGCGFIVRTNAVDQTKTTLTRDYNALMRLWKRVKQAAGSGKGPKLLYSDQDLILQALRDLLDKTISEVLVDTDAAHAKAKEYLAAFMPRSKTKLVRYDQRAPLFSKFDIESKIDHIYDRRVELPSGGSIVIDRTEALTAIDVNSGRATKGASHDETAFNTNLEAAAEVGRQLRLRDIGGLLVVDFIDMRAQKHQRKVEKALRDSMKPDRARCSVGRISQNGLLEINRQRIQQALHLRTQRACPTCDGTGRIASAEMISLNLLRRITGQAATGAIERVRVRMHPELADAFQNLRRAEIAALEEEFEISVEIIASPGLHRPEQEVEWTPRRVRRPPPAAAATTESSAVQISDATEDDDTEGSSGRRRRRRRGGRRRRNADAASDKDDSATSESDERDEETPRRRTRRSTRTRRSATLSGKTSDGDSKESSKDDDSDDNENKTSRPRRRGRTSRRLKAADDDQPETTDEAIETKDDDQEKPTRPRRRGRTSRRRRSASDDSEANEPNDSRSSESSSDPSSDLSSNKDDSEESSAPRRRPRRGRTSRRRSTAAEADQAESDGSTDDTRESETSEDSAEDKKTSTRSRSRRAAATRRRTSRTSGASQSKDEASEPPSTEESSQEDQKPAPRSRRRTRSRSKSDSDAETASETKSEAENEAEADTEAESKPAPRSRRSRTSRGRRSTAKAKDETAGESADDSGSEADSSSNESKETETPNRRRSTRSARSSRSRTPSTGKAKESDAEPASSSDADGEGDAAAAKPKAPARRRGGRRTTAAAKASQAAKSAKTAKSAKKDGENADTPGASEPTQPKIAFADIATRAPSSDG